MTTDQPRRASSTALAAPIPDEAPVMMATLVMGRQTTAAAGGRGAQAGSGQQLLVGVAQGGELGLAARAGVGERLAGPDRDADLLVILGLGLGAARPHDHAPAAGELEHQDVGWRQAIAAARQVDDRLDRMA